MSVMLDRRSYLVQVEPDHAPEADHREETLPVGATDRHHTDFQDGGEFGNGQPGALHTVPFMTRCGMGGPYSGAQAGGNSPVVLLSGQEWSGGVRSSEGVMARVWWIMMAPSS